MTMTMTMTMPTTMPTTMATTMTTTVTTTMTMAHGRTVAQLTLRLHPPRGRGKEIRIANLDVFWPTRVAHDAGMDDMTDAKLASMGEWSS